MRRRQVAGVGVASLYRRCLRVASFCVEEHRPWMASYVRMRFRDDALAGSGPEMLQRRLREAEDELQRMISTLTAAGRMEAVAETAPSEVSQPVSSTSESSHPNDWDENAVGAWLQGLGLGQHRSAFARCRIDGRLLMRLDDEDLVGELSVSSRLERKRVLVEIERLREGLILL